VDEDIEGLGFKSLYPYVTHYQLSQAQINFLRRKFAKEHDEEGSCDCRGGIYCIADEPCKGFQRNCVCDQRSVLKELRDEIAAKKAMDTGEPGF
jgi:hypothetical protein